MGFLKKIQILVGDDRKIIHASTGIYYHGSSTNHGKYLLVHQDVNQFGVDFGGVFASMDIDVARSHGKYIYEIELNDNDILDHYTLSYEIDHNKVYKIIADELKHRKNFNADDIGILYDVIEKDEGTDLSEEEKDVLFRVFNTKCLGEADWEVQGLRGKVAKELGYKAVKMNDEHGTSYLVMAPAKLERCEFED